MCYYLQTEFCFTHLTAAMQKTVAPHLFICNLSQNSCLRKLKAGKLQKFAIANENWVKQLPTELQNMSFGSLSLMRPIQSHGRVTKFQGTTESGGSS